MCQNQMNHIRGILHTTMVSPVVMCGCESWAINRAERRRIDAFELWCWRRLLRVPWTARKSNQSILKEISPEYSLEGLMLNLKLQYFGHLMQRTDSFGNTQMLGNIEGWRRKSNRGWDGWMASPTQCTRVWVDSRSWWWTGRPGVLRFMESQRVGHDWATELNWADTFVKIHSILWNGSSHREIESHGVIRWHQWGVFDGCGSRAESDHLAVWTGAQLLAQTPH